jgi:hypothetical protein
MKLHRLFALALVLVGALLVLGLADVSLAQPFGIRRGASEVGGLAGWILAKQAEFYRMIRVRFAPQRPTVGRPIR